MILTIVLFLTHTLIISPESELNLECADLARLSSDLRSRVNFCHAAACLHPETRKDDGSTHLATDQMRLLANTMSERLVQSTRGTRSHDDSPAFPEQGLLFHSVGILSDIVRQKLDPQDRAQFKLPLFHRLPLVDFGIKPPTPFWNDRLDPDRSWKNWLCRYNAAASQYTKLEGEWIGIYEAQRGAQRVDPMMENIHFQLGPGDRMVEEAVDIAAKGCFDSVGEFALRGSIDKNGRFEMVKAYSMGTFWHWDGAMTPFGFVGVWQRPGSSQRGLFWLYKRSWCEESEQTFTDIPTSDVTIEPYAEEPDGWEPDYQDNGYWDSEDWDEESEGFEDEDAEDHDSSAGESEDEESGNENPGV